MEENARNFFSSDACRFKNFDQILFHSRFLGGYADYYWNSGEVIL